jgi:hypothetical protein
MHWEQLPDIVNQWYEKLAQSGFDLRQATSNVITGSHVGYYIDPDTSRVGIFAPLASTADSDRIKKAACRATGTEPLFLSYYELSDPNGTWVKVAHSPTLRRAGEIGNFFPGQFPGGIPNNPSPIAAMLTSGLLGAGLGWGTGKLIGKLLPEGYGKKLGRTGLLLGGALGAAPGAFWGLTNKLDGRSFNDPSLLNHQAGEEVNNYPTAIDGTNLYQHQTDSGENPTRKFIENAQHTLHQSPLHKLKFGEDLVGIELGKMYKTAVEKVADTFGYQEPRLGYLPTDVNIDVLGRTLWDAGATPQLAGSTMAGMYAAQQMPDSRSRPGWVTGNQLGQLAANAAGDYAKGYLAGAAINTVIGTPFRNSSFGLGNAVLGVLGAVVPKLFGG